MINILISSFLRLGLNYGINRPRILLFVWGLACGGTKMKEIRTSQSNNKEEDINTDGVAI